MEILWADDTFVAVAKPPGLLSVPGRGPEKADCVHSRLLAKFPEARVVHRLDQPTSGVLIFALTADAQRQLSSLFETRQMVKRYEAIVQGGIEESAGLIDLPLSTDWPNRPRQKICSLEGKSAQTEYEVLADANLASKGLSRVSLTPRTGRTHQLRVHLQAVGHPIVGDSLYGDGKDGDRLLLHAASLEFAHPVSGEWVSLSSKVPF